jgi:hypothetical protein
MTLPLHYLLAREKQADLIRRAERSRLAEVGRPVESNSARRGLTARVLTELRRSTTHARAKPTTAASRVEPLVDTVVMAPDPESVST